MINRIITDPNICNGKPVIRGLRITVSTIIEYLAAGETVENLLRAYPVLEPEDIKACLEYAAMLTDKQFLQHNLHATS